MCTRRGLLYVLVTSAGAICKCLHLPKTATAAVVKFACPVFKWNLDFLNEVAVVAEYDRVFGKDLVPTSIEREGKGDLGIERSGIAKSGIARSGHCICAYMCDFVCYWFSSFQKRPRCCVVVFIYGIYGRADHHWLLYWLPLLRFGHSR